MLIVHQNSQQAWANWLISRLSIFSVCELRTASSARIFPYQDSADQLVLALGCAVLKNFQSLLVCGWMPCVECLKAKFSSAKEKGNKSWCQDPDSFYTPRSERIAKDSRMISHRSWSHPAHLPGERLRFLANFQASQSSSTVKTVIFTAHKVKSQSSIDETNV